MMLAAHGVRKLAPLLNHAHQALRLHAKLRRGGYNEGEATKIKKHRKPCVIHINSL